MQHDGLALDDAEIDRLERDKNGGALATWRIKAVQPYFASI